MARRCQTSTRSMIVSSAWRVFQIDFCCQGGRTLHQGCEKRGVAVATVIGQLDAEASVSTPGLSNPATLPPAELASWIVTTHHGFLRRELTRLRTMADRVAHVHGGHTPSLVEVQEVFTSLRLELKSHIMKEEQILFPAISNIAEGRREPVALDGPIACMIHAPSLRLRLLRFHPDPSRKLLAAAMRFLMRVGRN